MTERFLRTGRKPKGEPIPTHHDSDLYIWRTCLDGKVRESHGRNEGRLFRLSNPPRTGNPGDDYNCRCQADHNIPVWVKVVDKQDKSFEDLMESLRELKSLIELENL